MIREIKIIRRLTLKEELQLIDWDSLILAPLASKVPNTNACPEECLLLSLRGHLLFWGRLI